VADVPADAGEECGEGRDGDPGDGEDVRERHGRTPVNCLLPGGRATLRLDSGRTVQYR
jgi:hypothetical protein